MLPLTVPTGRFGRTALGVLLAGSVLVRPVGAHAAPGTDPPAPSATWAVTLNRATLYSGPSEDAVAFGDIPALVTLQVLDYDGDWSHVYNPRTQTEAYVPSDQLGPGEAPSRYVTMPPPAMV